MRPVGVGHYENFPGRVAGCARPHLRGRRRAPRSTPSRARPTTSPTRAVPRPADPHSPSWQRLRAATVTTPGRLRRRPACQPPRQPWPAVVRSLLEQSAAIAQFPCPRQLPARPARRLSARRREDPRRRRLLTPAAQRCSNYCAGARPTRSGSLLLHLYADGRCPVAARRAESTRVAALQLINFLAGPASPSTCRAGAIHHADQGAGPQPAWRARTGSASSPLAAPAPASRAGAGARPGCAFARALTAGGGAPLVPPRVPDEPAGSCGWWRTAARASSDESWQRASTALLDRAAPTGLRAAAILPLLAVRAALALLPRSWFSRLTRLLAHDARSNTSRTRPPAAARASTTPSCSCRRRGAPRSPRFYAFCREVDDVVDEVHRPRRGGHQAGLVAARRSRSASPARPAIPVMQALMPHAADLRHRGAHLLGGDRRLPDGPRPDALPRLRRPARAIATWWPAWSARSRRASSAARSARDGRSYAHRLGPGDAADQHHPRRRRRRAPRPHLPAGRRSCSSSTSRRSEILQARMRPWATASASPR